MSLECVIEVLRWLHDEHFDFFVVGGWALDAVLGHETRPHSDVDIVLFSGQRDELLTRLHERDDVRVCETGLPDKLIFADATPGVPSDIADKWCLLQARADGWAGALADISFFKLSNGRVIAQGVQWNLDVSLPLLFDHLIIDNKPAPPFPWRASGIVPITGRVGGGGASLTYSVPVGNAVLIAKMQSAFAYHPGEREAATALVKAAGNSLDFEDVQLVSLASDTLEVCDEESAGGLSDIDD